MSMLGRDPTCEAGNERGASTIEYAALLVLAAAVVGALLAGIPARVAGVVEPALCGIFQENCAETGDGGVAAEGNGQGGSGQGGDRPGGPAAQGDGGAREGGARGPAGFVNSISSWFVPGMPVAGGAEGCVPYQPCFPELPDLTSYDGGFFEVDDHGTGYRVYIRRQATELLAFTVHDICARLAHDDREKTGRCILSLLRNLDMAGTPSVLRDQMNHLAKSKRADDLMDAIEEVRDAVEDGDDACLAVSRTWGWGGQTNWDSRDSEDGHCTVGTDPAQGQDTSNLDLLLSQINGFDDFAELVNDPEGFVRGLPAVQGFPPEVQQQWVDSVREFVDGLDDLTDQEALLDDLEDDLG